MLNSLNRVCNCVQLKRGCEIGAFARDEQNNGPAVASPIQGAVGRRFHKSSR
jgi:hypothetical protein